MLGGALVAPLRQFRLRASDAVLASSPKSKQRKSGRAMATTNACGSQSKETGEYAKCWAVEESSEWAGVGAPASAAEQAAASGTEYATAVEEQIEQSKRHWSCLSAPSPSMLHDVGMSTSSCSSLADHNDVAVELDNRAVFHKLMDQWGDFFCTFGYDTEKWLSLGSLEVGEKFAEGAQAEIFHVHVMWNDRSINEFDRERGRQWVLKVFKKGTLLRHLQFQWPQGYLHFRVEVMERSRLGKPLGYRWHCNVVCGTLLEDGRFAFLMVKEDEDLWRLIERNMAKIGHHGGGPFSKEEEEEYMYNIARGMEWLHRNNIVHRDLKASNVLVRKCLDGGYGICIADYECSVGVVGMGFFRAPEILQACKEKKVHERQELFSRGADIYSYGMTCYEVLTGKLPFEDHLLSDNMHLLIDLVINGLHPEVPEYVDGWKRELLQSCWQPNVDGRPTVEEILRVFESNSKSEYILEEAVERERINGIELLTL